MSKKQITELERFKSSQLDESKMLISKQTNASLSSYCSMQISSEYFLNVETDQTIKADSSLLADSTNAKKFSGTIQTVTPAIESDPSSVVNIDWFYRDIDQTLLWGFDDTYGPGSYNNAYGYPVLNGSHNTRFLLYLKEDFNNFEKLQFIFIKAAEWGKNRLLTLDTAKLSDDISAAIHIDEVCESLSAYNTTGYKNAKYIQYPYSSNVLFNISCHVKGGPYTVNKKGDETNGFTPTANDTSAWNRQYPLLYTYNETTTVTDFKSDGKKLLIGFNPGGLDYSNPDNELYRVVGLKRKSKQMAEQAESSQPTENEAGEGVEGS